jgi:hypothetical protein
MQYTLHSCAAFFLVFSVWNTAPSSAEINAVPAGDTQFSGNKDGVDLLFTIERAPEFTHLYYWARPFWVSNGAKEYGGYLGLQSHNNGKKIALFSFFGVGKGGIKGDLPGAKLNVENKGFDGDPAGKGTQTVAPFEWKEGVTYRFRVTSGNRNGKTYVFTHIKDLSTEQENLLGAIEVDPGTWKIKARLSAFTEIAYGKGKHKYGHDWGDYANTISYARARFDTISLDGEVAKVIPGSYGKYKYCDPPEDAIPNKTIGVSSHRRGHSLIHEAGLYREHYVHGNIHRYREPKTPE